MATTRCSSDVASDFFNSLLDPLALHLKLTSLTTDLAPVAIARRTFAGARRAVCQILMLTTTAPGKYGGHRKVPDRADDRSGYAG
jgi:hypothetical protein